MKTSYQSSKNTGMHVLVPLDFLQVLTFQRLPYVLETMSYKQYMGHNPVNSLLYLHEIMWPLSLAVHQLQMLLSLVSFKIHKYISNKMQYLITTHMKE